MLKGLRRVRGCTQQVNVSRSSHGFPSLPENVGSCTDACLTWAGLQLLGEGSVLQGRAQPGERDWHSPGKAGVQRLPLVQLCQALGAGCRH